MLISIRTTSSMQVQIILGFPRKSRNLQARLRVRTRTAVRRKRLSCWCATEPALDSKDAGTEQKNLTFPILNGPEKQLQTGPVLFF